MLLECRDGGWGLCICRLAVYASRRLAANEVEPDPEERPVETIEDATHGRHDAGLPFDDHLDLV